MQVPMVKQVAPAPIIPTRVEYSLANVSCPAPVDWVGVACRIQAYLDSHASDLAFAYWCDAWRRELAASSSVSPQKSPRHV